jgi:hypothetical protein
VTKFAEIGIKEAERHYRRIPALMRGLTRKDADMKITTRIDEMDVVIVADETQIGAYEYSDGDLRTANLQAEAYAEGVRRGMELAKSAAAGAEPASLSLYSWDSEAVGDDGYPCHFAAMAPDEETARKKIVKLAETYVIRRAVPVHLEQLDEELKKAPLLNPDEAFLFVKY